MLYDSHKPQNLDLPYDLYIHVHSIWPRSRIRNFKVEKRRESRNYWKPRSVKYFFGYSEKQSMIGFKTSDCKTQGKSRLFTSRSSDYASRQVFMLQDFALRRKFISKDAHCLVFGLFFTSGHRSRGYRSDLLKVPKEDVSPTPPLSLFQFFPCCFLAIFSPVSCLQAIQCPSLFTMEFLVRE